MNWGELELQYRKAALNSATPVGVIMMLYDQLVKDLRKAITAIEGTSPEECATAIKHALLVLQQLEGSLDHESGSDLVKWLVRFYSLLRTRVIEAQVQSSAQILNEQVSLILDVRGAWQQLESRDQVAAMSPSHTASSSANFASSEDFRSTTWSA